MTEIPANSLLQAAPVEDNFSVRPRQGTALMAFVVFGIGFIAVVSMSSALVGYKAWRLFNWLMG